MEEEKPFSPQPPAKEDPPAASPKSGNGKRKRAGVILMILFLSGGIFGGRWWLWSKSHISTDNAFVESHIHAVASRIPGVVKTVAVRDNQFVKQGELLVEIDPVDYQVRVREAAASLAMAANETSGEYARVDAVKAEVSQSRARLAQAELDLQRGKALFSREVVPREQLERLETARTVATAQLQEKEEVLRRAQAEAGLSGNGGSKAKVAQRRAQLDGANLHLAYTRVFAPVAGYVTRKGVEAGNYIQTGQPLMAVVPLNASWITANYKEGQLAHVRPGQEVEFTVDAFPGQRFRGTVESIMAGTGAAFSLLPPENATGNYVKVVQRIPVRIAIDRQSDPGNLLRIGMSVVPTILVKRTMGEILREALPL